MANQFFAKWRKRLKGTHNKLLKRTPEHSAVLVVSVVGFESLVKAPFSRALCTFTENQKFMDENTEIWRQYYEKALSRPHSKRTEFAVRLNESNLKVATDCGCGTGSDIEYLNQQNYQVHGFDINPDSVAICRDRFGSKSLVDISESSFESFNYPKSGVVIANSSLFFADPNQFESTWGNIKSSIEIGGVFAGDFMGLKDSWAYNYRSPTTPLSEPEVKALFSGFEIVRFIERDEKARTSLGRMKHWHTYSVVAVKRT